MPETSNFLIKLSLQPIVGANIGNLVVFFHKAKPCHCPQVSNVSVCFGTKYELHWAKTTCQLTLDNNSMKLSRKLTGLLAVALLAFMVTGAVGQDQDQGGAGGGRGGAGGGFGGRTGGGGFGGGRTGGGDMTMTLLRLEPVRTELEISPDQEEALTKMTEQNRSERPSGDFRNMSEDERTEFFAKMRKQSEERTAKMKEQLEEVLFPEQLERLEQINIQLQGIAALQNAEVAKKLKMTAAQTKELEEVRNGIMEKMRDSMREIFASGNREGIREKIEKMRDDMEGDVLAVLNTDQKKKFEEMKGEPFEMPEGAMRGGRGGQGGAPGGQQGRGGFGGRGGGDQGGRGGRGGGDQGGGGERQRPEVE